jgi:hypothetical protein
VAKELGLRPVLLKILMNLATIVAFVHVRLRCNVGLKLVEFQIEFIISADLTGQRGGTGQGSCP